MDFTEIKMTSGKQLHDIASDMMDGSMWDLAVSTQMIIVLNNFLNINDYS